VKSQDRKKSGIFFYLINESSSVERYNKDLFHLFILFTVRRWKSF